MHLRLFAVAGIASLLLLSPVAANAQCCDPAKHATHDVKAGCCDMPCCKDQKASVEPSAIEVLLNADPQLAPAAPVRQAVEVWFHQAVMVGRSLFQGHYVIEHDNDRMARGEPCTHIYAFDDQTTPVATFHCTHLERARADENIVVLQNGPDPHIKKLTEFQFAGETASHGYPTVR